MWALPGMLGAQASVQGSDHVTRLLRVVNSRPVIALTPLH